MITKTTVSLVVPAEKTIVRSTHFLWVFIPTKTGRETLFA